VKKLILAVAGSALTLFVVNAGATSTAIVTKSQVVEFGDLDLTRNAGAQTLYKRLRIAAREVCKPEVERYFVKAWKGYNKCVNDSVATAVATVDSETLRAYAATQMAGSAVAG
jgi:UrcA family protein